MATRRTLDTRSTARARHYTNAFTTLRVLACTQSARESIPPCHSKLKAKLNLNSLYGKFLNPSRG